MANYNINYDIASGNKENKLNSVINQVTEELLQCRLNIPTSTEYMLILKNSTQKNIRIITIRRMSIQH